jgi:hypothetical protein
MIPKQSDVPPNGRVNGLEEENMAVLAASSPRDVWKARVASAPRLNGVAA